MLYKVDSTKLHTLLLVQSTLSEPSTPGPVEPLPPTRALSDQGHLPESSKATSCLGVRKEVASPTPCHLQNEKEIFLSFFCQVFVKRERRGGEETGREGHTHPGRKIREQSQLVSGNSSH